MFQLQDGRNELYQWDINRKVRVSDPTVSEVHFCNKTDDCSLVVKVYADPTDSELYADIPNILLQNDFPIRAYAYAGEGYTKVEKVFKVHSRTKPADYVYTETEVITVQTIEKRMDELEETFNTNIGKAVSDYIEEHPVEVDLTGYATEEWVEGKGYLTEHQSLEGLATEEYVDNAIANIDIPEGGGDVDLSDYYTKEETDTAIYNSKDSYYIRLSNIPTGEENAITASDDLVEFATRFMNDRNVCLHFQDNDGFTNAGYKSANIISVGNKITFKDTTIDVTRIAQNGPTHYFNYTLKLSGTDWVIYKTPIGSFTLTTKEYVDGLFANIATAEGGSY